MGENYHVIPYGHLTDDDVQVDDIVMVSVDIEQQSRTYRNRTEKKHYDVTAIVEAKGDFLVDESDETIDTEAPQSKPGVFYQCIVMSHGSLMGMELKNVEINDIAKI